MMALETSAVAVGGFADYKRDGPTAWAIGAHFLTRQRRTFCTSTTWRLWRKSGSEVGPTSSNSIDSHQNEWERWPAQIREGYWHTHSS